MSSLSLNRQDNNTTFSLGSYWANMANNKTEFEFFAAFFNQKDGTTLKESREAYGISSNGAHLIINNGLKTIKRAFNRKLINPEVLNNLSGYATQVTEIDEIQIKDTIFTGAAIARIATKVLPFKFELVDCDLLDGVWFSDAEKHTEFLIESIVSNLEEAEVSVRDIKARYGFSESLLSRIKGTIIIDGYLYLAHLSFGRTSNVNKKTKQPKLNRKTISAKPTNKVSVVKTSTIKPWLTPGEVGLSKAILEIILSSNKVFDESDIREEIQRRHTIVGSLDQGLIKDCLRNLVEERRIYEISGMGLYKQFSDSSNSISFVKSYY